MSETRPPAPAPVTQQEGRTPGKINRLLAAREAPPATTPASDSRRPADGGTRARPAPAAPPGEGGLTLRQAMAEVRERSRVRQDGEAPGAGERGQGGDGERRGNGKAAEGGAEFDVLATLTGAPPGAGDPAAGAGEDAAETAGEDRGGDDDAGEAPITLRIGGEERRYTRADLARFVAQGEDYTRKTQTVAEERRAVAAAKAEYEKLTPLLNEAVRHARAQAEAATGGKEPDWEKLAQDDPIGAMQQMAKWQKVKQLREAEAQLDEERKADARRRAKEYVDAEHERLCELVPGWKDDAKRPLIQRELGATAKAYGYTAAELAASFDHRQILVLRDATLYRELVKRGVVPGGAKTPAPSPARPGNGGALGSRGAGRGQAALREAEAAHEQQGTRDSALNLLRARREARERQNRR